MKVTNERSCEFAGCADDGLPRYCPQDIGEPDERNLVCDEHWIAYRAETLEIPSEPIPPFGCTNETFQKWLERVSWRPGSVSEVEAEHARLMDEHARGLTVH